jgi:hypothetical protein
LYLSRKTNSTKSLQCDDDNNNDEERHLVIDFENAQKEVDRLTLENEREATHAYAQISKASAEIEGVQLETRMVQDRNYIEAENLRKRIAFLENQFDESIHLDERLMGQIRVKKSREEIKRFRQDYIYQQQIEKLEDAVKSAMAELAKKEIEFLKEERELDVMKKEEIRWLHPETATTGTQYQKSDVNVCARAWMRVKKSWSRVVKIFSCRARR